MLGYGVLYCANYTMLFLEYMKLAGFSLVLVHIGRHTLTADWLAPTHNGTDAGAWFSVMGHARWLYGMSQDDATALLPQLRQSNSSITLSHF